MGKVKRWKGGKKVGKASSVACENLFYFLFFFLPQMVLWEEKVNS